MALDGGLEGGYLLRCSEVSSIDCEFGVSQRFGVHAVCERGTCEFRVSQEFTLERLEQRTETLRVSGQQ